MNKSSISKTTPDATKSKQVVTFDHSVKSKPLLVFNVPVNLNRPKTKNSVIKSSPKTDITKNVKVTAGVQKSEVKNEGEKSQKKKKKSEKKGKRKSRKNKLQQSVKEYQRMVTPWPDETTRDFFTYLEVKFFFFYKILRLVVNLIYAAVVYVIRRRLSPYVDVSYVIHEIKTHALCQNILCDGIDYVVKVNYVLTQNKITCLINFFRISSEFCSQRT